MIQVGEMAPDFTLDSTMGTFLLSALRGQQIAVLIFYPKDNTPGCNLQLSAARDAAEEYRKRGAQVVAINPDSLESHRQWAEEFGFDFPICVDVDKKVALAYGAVKPEDGIQRCVIIVDKRGSVHWVAEGRPETAEILQAIDAMAANDPDGTRLSSS